VKGPPARCRENPATPALKRDREGVDNREFCLFARGWLVQGIWIALRGDFTVLPRLTYPEALGVIALWGLLFLLVLTMISGDRELMTPGAWK
jgi:hypothetical protein